MAGKLKFSNADIIKALEEKKGMIYLAAKLIGCHPDTIFKRARRSKAIQAAIDSARGVMLDNAETKLDTAINNGESWAIAFALRTIGRNRGYVERQEVSGADGGPLEIKFTWEDDDYNHPNAQTAHDHPEADDNPSG